MTQCKKGMRHVAAIKVFSFTMFTLMPYFGFGITKNHIDRYKSSFIDMKSLWKTNKLDILWMYATIFSGNMRFMRIFNNRLKRYLKSFEKE